MHPPLPIRPALDVGPGKWTEPKQLPKGRTWQDMKDEFEEGVSIFEACWNAPIDRIAAENPEMNDLARERMPEDLPEPQIVQPFWFGHPEYKATGWYLRNLPRLEPTDMLLEPERGSPDWIAWNRVPPDAAPDPSAPGLGSRSFPNMMKAAAVQWAGYAVEHLRNAA